MDVKQRWGWIAHVYKACAQQHHRELRPLLAPLIPADGVVLDIGAHAGQFAKLFARLAPRGRVYAFEPSPYALSILRLAARTNGLDNIIIQPLGLSDTLGTARLTTPIKRRGDIGFGLAHFGEADRPGRHIEHEVRITTLDLACGGLERIDFIKIDIEGWELRALRGGARTLARFRPPIFAEANHGHLARAGATPAQLWAFLQGLGYQASRDGAEAPAYCGPGDYLWRVAEPSSSRTSARSP
jgi:FkbM family methyltransferase